MVTGQVDLVAVRAPGPFGALVSEMELAERIGISLKLEYPAYDCFYLALAETEAAVLITADERLLGRVRASPWVDRIIGLDRYGPT